MERQVIEEKITAKKKQISQVEKELSEKQAFFEEKKKLYAQGVLDNFDQSRKKPSLKIKKQDLAEMRIEVEGLEDVKSLLHTELETLETEQKRCDLYEKQGLRFKKAMADCNHAHGQIVKLFKSLKNDLVDFSSNVSVLIEKQQVATSALRLLCKNLDPGLSLSSFLNGEVKELEKSDMGSVTQQIRNKIMEVSHVEFEKIEDEFSTFQNTMDVLDQWRRFIAKQNFQTTHAFVPKQKAKSHGSRRVVLDYKLIQSQKEKTEKKNKAKCA